MFCPKKTSSDGWTCALFWLHHNKASFLDQILICDEKWVMYDSLKIKWTTSGSISMATKRDFYKKKREMFCVWYTSARIVHYEIIEIWRTITVHITRILNSSHDQRISADMLQKQSALVIRRGSVLPHDNVIPHMRTWLKHWFGAFWLIHFTYSMSTDRIINFLSMNNHLREQQLWNWSKATEIAIQLLDLKKEVFLRKSIYKLVPLWEHIIKA